jgi:transcriptional regulator GlxA family with amidase domain
LIRIKNLLESREQLRKLFQKNKVLEPSAVTVTPIDEKFLSTLVKQLEEGIPDSDFSVSSLESNMGMSHANFYRKVKSLTGLSGQELLMSMRLKRAHQIMSEHTGIRIAEIAYMVGFNNPNHFSKCFKKMYGIAPSDFK